MGKLITGEKIVKTFGKGNEMAKVLDGVDIEISKGEFVAVMGPSGSGKTTLLFTLSGTDTVTGGSVKFKDVNLSQLGENELADIRRASIGFVFQQPTMLKNLNILDNIILPAMYGDKKNKAGIIEKARSLMEKTGIAELEKRDITEVSGGQLQRAGICRAIMNSPDILFADEPTGALNTKSADEIMALLVAVNKEGAAILLVTHDAKVASRADRVLFMKDGAIVYDLSLTETAESDFDLRTEKVIMQMQAVGI